MFMYLDCIIYVLYLRLLLKNNFQDCQAILDLVVALLTYNIISSAILPMHAGHAVYLMSGKR
jgi:hypothetical protein